MRQDWIATLRRSLIRYGLSLAAILLAFWVRQALQFYLGSGLPPYVTFFPVVMVVAVAAGFRAGLLVTLVAAFLSEVWILPPVGRLAIDRPTDVIGLLMFVGVGIGMSVFAEVFRKTRLRAAVSEKELALRESEVALHRSRERLRVTLTSIGDAVMSCDAAGRVTFINPKAEELTGWKTEDASGKPIHEVLRVVDEDGGNPSEDSSSRVLPERRAVGRTGLYALLKQDGSQIPIEKTASPILDADGEPAGAVVVFHDVTEQRQIQHELEASERRYRTLVEMAPEAVVVHQYGKIVYANAAALRLYGAKTFEELQTRNILDLIHPDDRDAIRARVQTVEAGGSTPLRETRILRMDGSEAPVEATAGSVDWYGQVAVQTILRDITARKLAEAALIQTEKLASVGRMAASIAHEINNPLAAVMNTLYIARHTPEMPAPALEYLDLAEEELKRISHITRQVLGFYRESGTTSLMPVSAIMDSALDLLQSRIKAKQAKIEKLYRGEPEVMSSSGELRQVFSNLLANSLDSIAENGTVKIRISSAKCAVSGVRTVRITVADNGTGIKQEIRPRIFEALFTTKRSTGTGLGLWVSKQIVEKHGGSIRFRSRTAKGKSGTAFSVVLAATRDALPSGRAE
jgi:PAS domain S-box-containing protein